MRVTSRRLRQHLEHMGTAPVAPPSPGFVARTEEHLRTLRPLSAAEPVRPAPRLRARPVWVSVAMATAAAAAVVGLVAPEGEQRVVVTTGGPAATASTGPTTDATPATAPPTTGPAPVTTVAPPPATTTTTVPAPARPTTPTTAVAPGPTTAPRTEPSPATTTTRPSEPTTTTSAPPKSMLRLICVAGSDPTPSFAVTCTWSAPTDPTLAGWRVHRAVGANPKMIAFTSSDPATLSWVDGDVVQGGVYRYVVEAVAGDGRTIAKSAIVEVACCPV